MNMKMITKPKLSNRNLYREIRVFVYFRKDLLLEQIHNYPLSFPCYKEPYRKIDFIILFYIKSIYIFYFLSGIHRQSR
jgi:hypothetical protein